MLRVSIITNGFIVCLQLYTPIFLLLYQRTNTRMNLNTKYVRFTIEISDKMKGIKEGNENSGKKLQRKASFNE